MSEVRTECGSTLHLVGAVDGAEAKGGGVPADAACLAAAWCEYLEAHAERVYASEGPRSAAGALARRIEFFRKAAAVRGRKLN